MAAIWVRKDATAALHLVAGMRNTKTKKMAVYSLNINMYLGRISDYVYNFSC